MNPDDPPKPPPYSLVVEEADDDDGFILLTDSAISDHITDLIEHTFFTESFSDGAYDHGSGNGNPFATNVPFLEQDETGCHFKVVHRVWKTLGFIRRERIYDYVRFIRLRNDYRIEHDLGKLEFDNIRFVPLHPSRPPTSSSPISEGMRWSRGESGR